MRIFISRQEQLLLHSAGIEFDPQKEFDDDTAFSLLDAVREREVLYAQEGKTASAAMIWAKLADKIQSQIPEE